MHRFAAELGAVDAANRLVVVDEGRIEQSAGEFVNCSLNFSRLFAQPPQRLGDLRIIFLR